MKQKTTYSFLTTNGFRTPDIKAYNPKQAYRIAMSKSYALIMTKTYIKFDKNSVSDGAYYSL